jgi:hypothetical protein
MPVINQPPPDQLHVGADVLNSGRKVSQSSLGRAL